ncbi:hypothetical protein K502DRAFT_324313 [Neoconidiobolus thromboides FSU 785]|nr:hypothetical protein K502DRAFT_324313 [Neoconidiobolus thromboides FSU 785]
MRKTPARISTDHSRLGFIPNEHRNTVSVPNSPAPSHVSYSTSIINLITKDTDNINSRSYDHPKSSVWKKVANWGKGVKNVGLGLHQNNHSSSRVLFTNHATQSKVNTRGRRVSISATDELVISSRNKKDNIIEEEPMSWVELLKSTRSSWDVGLQVNTGKDGSQKVECFYDDKVNRQKLKTMISTSDFDDILKEGYVGSCGTRLDTIRVTLTPEKVKMDSF